MDGAGVRPAVLSLALSNVIVEDAREGFVESVRGDHSHNRTSRRQTTCRVSPRILGRARLPRGGRGEASSPAAPGASPAPGTPLAGRRPRVMEEAFGVEVGVVPPHRPEGGEDLALGVEPGVSGGAGAAFAFEVEAADGVAGLAGAHAGAPGVVGDGLEFAPAGAVDAFVAQRLAVAAAAGDAQGAEAQELAGGLEAVGILDHGAEDMRADLADAGDLLEARDLGVGAAEAGDLGELFAPGAVGGVEEVVEEQQAVAPVFGHQGDPVLASGGVEERAAVEAQDADAAVAGLDVDAQFALGVAQLEQLVERGAEGGAVLVEASPDRVEGVEPEEFAQRAHVDLVGLVGRVADEPVVARVADDKAAGVGPEDFGGPAGDGSGLDGEDDLAGGQRSDGRDKVLVGGDELAASEHLALGGHPSDDRAGGVEVDGGVQFAFHGLVESGWT